MQIKCEYTELVDTHKLVPDPRNANKHGDRQIELLAKNIDYQGWRLPIIVSKRSSFVVAGHGRLEAAQKLGLEKVPVSYQDFDSEAAEFQFLISDNKLAALAEHDDSLMIEGIKELEIDDFELLGLDDFKFIIDEAVELEEKKPKEEDKKYKIEVEFPNDMEMMDIHDDLLHRGYLVRIV